MQRRSESRQGLAGCRGRRVAGALGTCVVGVLLLAGIGVGSNVAGALPSAGAGTNPLVSECNADARTVGVAVAAEMAVNPNTYPGRHGRATSQRWHVVLLSAGSGGPWLRTWPGAPHIYAISVAGSSSPRTTGDHVLPHDGDVLVNDYLDGKVYDATLHPAFACAHFAFSLKLVPSPGPTAQQVILPHLDRTYVPLPPGVYDGPLTQYNLGTFGLFPGRAPYEELQAEGASTYLRTWRSALGVVAIAIFQLRSPAAATRFTVENGQSGQGGFHVSTISSPAAGYLGVEEGTQANPGGPKLQIVEYLVHDQSYAVVVVADLVAGSGVEHAASTVLAEQVTRLHRVLPAGSGSGLGLAVAVAAAAGLVVLIVALVLVRRRSRRRSGDAASPAPASGAVATPSSVRTSPVAPDTSAAVTSVPEPKPASTFFCSWCGGARRANADALHHCGSRDRPPSFCSACGAPASGEVCSCGTPISQLSPVY